MNKLKKIDGDFGQFSSPNYSLNRLTRQLYKEHPLYAGRKMNLFLKFL